MSVKSEHLELLKKGSEIHAKRIDELRKQIKLMQDEIKMHSLIIEVGANEKLMKALNRLSDEPGFAETVKGKELAHLEKFGISLPKDSRIELSAPGSKTTDAKLFVKTGKYSFQVRWNSRLGFSAVPTKE